MSQANDQPAAPQPAPEAPQPELVIEQVHTDAGAPPTFRWELRQGGQLLALSAKNYPDNFAAAEGASQVSLMILHTLSRSFVKLGREIQQARAQGQAQSGEQVQEQAEAPAQTRAAGHESAESQLGAPAQAQVGASESGQAPVQDGAVA